MPYVDPAGSRDEGAERTRYIVLLVIITFGKGGSYYRRGGKEDDSGGCEGSGRKAVKTSM